MKGQYRRPWFIVAVLFVALVLCYGTILNTVGMFVAPLVKEFHWSRTQASVLTSVIALLSGVTSLLAGWLPPNRSEVRDGCRGHSRGCRIPARGFS